MASAYKQLIVLVIQSPSEGMAQMVLQEEKPWTCFCTAWGSALDHLRSWPRDAENTPLAERQQLPPRPSQSCDTLTHSTGAGLPAAAVL